MLRVAVLSLLLVFPVIASEPQKSRSKPDPKPAAMESPAGGEPVPVATEPNLPPLAERQRELIAKLQRPGGMARTFDGVPLKDVVDFFGDHFGVTFVINSLSFREQGDDKIEEKPLRLPAMKGASMRYLLDSAFDQINGTFLIRGDHLELVSKAYARREVFAKPVENAADEIRQSMPLINIVANRVPLDQVLADLADQSGRNVLIDARLPNAGKSLVTIRLLNTPIDTAVNIIAQMNDFIAVPIDNSIVVTSKGISGAFVTRDSESPGKSKQVANP